MTSRRRFSVALALFGAVTLFVAGCVDDDSDHAAGPLEVPESADASVGKASLEVYGCGTCHSIPGVAGANGRVGPPLDGFGQRLYIAGAVENNFENLVQWIMAPDEIEPGTLMPNLGVGERTASDIAAYLATLD